MNVAPRRRSYVPWFETARQFPVAYRLFVIWFWAITLINAGSFFASMTAPSVFERWLHLSAPVTDWLGRFIPAIRYTSGFLAEHRGSSLDLAIQNCFAFNFAIVLVFPPLVFVFALLDVQRSSKKISRKVHTIFSEVGTGMTASRYVTILFIFVGVSLPLMFFGLAMPPHTILQINYLYCFIEFVAVGGGACLMLMILALEVAGCSPDKQ